VNIVLFVLYYLIYWWCWEWSIGISWPGSCPGVWLISTTVCTNAVATITIDIIPNYESAAIW